MICPSCDNEAAAGSRFCNHCGAPLPVAAPRQDETRLITLLFADMSGSVEATQGLDPEAALERVNEALVVMSRTVVAHGGKVDRYLGDGIFALFGAPRASEDDPLRAIAAALAMLEEARGRDFDLSIGINTGDAYLGKVGSEAHRELTAMGPAVNLAARLQGACSPGEVLVGEPTWKIARRAFEFESREVKVKGLSHPVRVWRAVKARPRLERARGLEGLQAGLLGREGELARLSEALDRVRSGAGYTVTIAGEAGVGKSTLVGEIRRRAGTIGDGGTLWLEGRCLESTISTSYAPFVDLLRERFVPAAGQAALVDPIAEELATLVREGALAADRREDVLVPLLNLLSIPDPRAATFGDLPPQQVKSRTFLAILSYLSALASHRDIVVVLDDLHWADSLTLELVPRLAQSLLDSRALLICVQRPVQEHASRHLVSLVARHAGERHVEVRLHPLGDEQAGRLVLELLGTDEFPDAPLRAILDKAQGNPLFLEEILRSLLASDQIERRNGKVVVDADIRVDDVPTTVQSIIQSRVDRIDEEPRRVLQGAAVIGGVFARVLLETVVEPEVDVDRALWHLEQHDLVYLDRVEPEEMYSFKHVFTRDTVYRSLLKRRREELHLAVGRATEMQYADRLDEHLEMLAYHYDRTSDAGRAAHFLFRAGEKSRRAHLNDEAMGSFRRALARIDELEEAEKEAVHPVPAPDARRELRARVHESLGDVLELVGRHDEAVEAYDLALDDRSREERTARGRILRKVGLSRQVQRSREEALEAFDQAIEALGEPPLPADLSWDEERAAVELGKVMVHYFTSSPDLLADQIERSRPIVEMRGTSFQRAWLYNSLALLGLRREMYLASEETVEYARAGYEEARQGESRVEVADIHFSYAFCLMWANQLEEAEWHLHEILSQAERVGYATVRARCMIYLALIARRRGEVEDVRRWTGQAMQVAVEGGMPEYTSAGEAHLAWAALREGDVDRAEAHARRAFDAWPQSGGPYRVLAWMAAWPLLGVELERENLSAALELARYLLAPETQPAPAPVADALAGALAAAGLGDDELALRRLAEAAECAREPGLL